MIAGGTLLSDDFFPGYDEGRSIDGTPMVGKSDRRSITVRMPTLISEGEFDRMVRKGFTGVIDNQTTSKLIYDRQGLGPEGDPYLSKDPIERDTYLFRMTSRSGENFRVELTRPTIYGGSNYAVELEECVMICP